VREREECVCEREECVCEREECVCDREECEREREECVRERGVPQKQVCVRERRPPPPVRPACVASLDRGPCRRERERGIETQRAKGQIERESKRERERGGRWKVSRNRERSVR